MPCRYDPIVPKPSEREEMRRLQETGQKIADRLAALADILREEALGETPGEYKSRVVIAVGEAGQRMAEADGWMRDLTNLKNSTGFSDSSKDREAATEAVETVRRLVGELNEALRIVLLLAGGGEVDSYRLQVLRADQVRHRRMDLDRLLRTFADKASTAPAVERDEWVEKLRLVCASTPELPLFDQLGFDADEY